MSAVYNVYNVGTVSHDVVCELIGVGGTLFALLTIGIGL